MIGKTLGHYEILEALGQGGMGIVYKARDPRLDRFVAIKVLPPGKTGDLLSKQRFIREARAASALNHPNIVIVHEIGEELGSDFIVMEYIQGRTLDQVIPRKGLRAGEVLRYATQIAAALAAAHEAGITHRDLKPGNIMVTDKGVVKILDFGLAKLREPVTTENDETRTAALVSEEGSIVGTVAYMSPEQAEGKPVDARSDIFSFGVVLYEMLTGQRAFAGETKMSTLSAILREEPKPASELVPDVPRQLEWILLHCLRKDRQRRLQSTADLHVMLESLREESDSGKLAPPVAVTPHFRWQRPALAGLAIAAIGAAAWWWSRPPAPPPSRPAFKRLTFDSGLTTDPALSPDGKMIAYVSDRGGEGLDLWVQQLGGGSAIQLTQTPEDESEPNFSPDGTQIAFRAEREGGALYVVPTFGGQPRKVADQGRRPRFSPDGAWIAYWAGQLGSTGGMTNRKIFVVPTSGGAPKQIAPEVNGTSPLWTPDGKYLLLDGGRAGWFFAPVDGGPLIRTDVPTASDKERVFVFPLEMTRAGQVIFSVSSQDSVNLWAIRLDPVTRKPRGPAYEVSAGAGFETNPSVSASASGAMAFVRGDERLNIWFLPVNTDRGAVSGDPVPLTDDTAENGQPSLSADGSKLVYTSNRSSGWQIWFKDLHSRKDVQLTHARDLPQTLRARLSPDGLRVVYQYRGRGEGGRVFSMPSTGGNPRQVLDGCGTLRGWSSSADRLLCQGGQRLFWAEIATGKRVDVAQEPLHGIYSAGFSPDDQWVSFLKQLDPEHSQLQVAPARASVNESEWRAITDGKSWDDKPNWSPDGNLLYYISDRDGFRCLWAQRLEPTTKRPSGAPFAVYHFHRARRTMEWLPRQEVPVARDKIAFSLREKTGNIWLTQLTADPGR